MVGFGDLFGGGGSMMDMFKQNNQQSALMKLLGLGDSGQQYDAPIGPQQGAATPMPSSMIDPKLQSQQNASMLQGFGDKLGQFGAGMSKASGPSRTPVSFGQAMAGGNEAMQAGQNNNMDMQLKQAQIGALGAKAQPDFEKSAQAALVKSKMGLPLTPQEQATLQAFDTMNTAKLTYNQDASQQWHANPAARSILPPDMAGGAPSGQPGGGQQPGMQNLRGYYQYLQQKAQQP